MAPEHLFYLTWIILGSFDLFKTVSESAAISYDTDIHFTAEPKDAVVKRGTTIVLECSARIDTSDSNRERHRGRSHPGPNISWIKDGQPHPPSSVAILHHQILKNGSLRIRKVKQSANYSDEGLYQCLAESASHGVRVSRTARLQVAYLYRRNKDHEPVIQVYRGGVERLACNIEGLPLPSYIWTKDGIQLPQESRFIQLPSGVLEIAGVTASDEGQFQCTASNIARSRTSPKISLEILPGTYSGGLRVLATPAQVVRVGEGETVVLQCAASDNPLPQISWVNEDRLPISSGLARFQELGDSHNLQISSVRLQDSGAYICKIANQEHRATLEVDQKPRLVKIYSQHQNYLTGVVVNIQCEFQGFPTDDVIWTKDGIEITDSVRHSIMKTNPPYPEEDVTDTVRTLKIINTQKHDAGIYQCFLYNKAGQTDGAIRITITRAKNPPLPPTDLVALTVSHNKILIKWKPPNSKVEILGYSAHYAPVDDEGMQMQRVIDSNKTNITIESLEPYTRYRIYMQAYSGKVSSIPSIAVETTTNEFYPGGPPPKINCEDASEPFSLQIAWNPVPRRLAHGKITEYRLFVRKHGEKMPVKELRVDGEALQYKLEDLEVGQSYDMRLQPVNSVGLAKLYEEHWPWTTCTTSDSSVSVIRVDSVASGMVRVSWQPPIDSIVTNSPQVSSGIPTVSEYRLSCQDAKTQAQVFAVGHLPPNCYNYTVENLETEKEYIFSLTVLFENGSSEKFTQKFFVPGPTHIQLSAVSKTPTQIHVFWNTIQWENCDPVFILSYKMAPTEKDAPENPEKAREINILDDVSSPIVIEDLLAFTRYNISVTGTCQNRGVKPHQQQSKVVSIRTLPGKPSRPEKFQVDVLEGSVVRLKWHIPIQDNGVISHFSVFYTQDEELALEEWELKLEFGNATESTIEGLLNNQTYYFKVCADTAAGHGEFSEVLAVMTGEIPISSPSDKYGTELGIILGVVTGGGCIIMCTVLLLIIYLKPCCVRTCCRRRRHSCSHVNGTQPPDGYGYRYRTSHEVEYRQPMLLDNHIDTKGGKSPPELRGLSNGHPVPTMELYNGSVRSNLLPYDCEQETGFGADNTQLPLTTNSIGESQETADTGYSEPRDLEGEDDLDLEDAISDMDTSTQLADSPQNCSYPCSCSITPDTDPLDMEDFIERQRHHRDCHFYHPKPLLPGEVEGGDSISDLGWELRPCTRHSVGEMVKPPLIAAAAVTAGSSGGEFPIVGGINHHGNNSIPSPPDDGDADDDAAVASPGQLPPQFSSSTSSYQTNTSEDQVVSEAAEKPPSPHLQQPGHHSSMPVFVRSNTSSSSPQGSNSSSISNSSPITAARAPHCQTSVADLPLPSNNGVHDDDASNLSIPPPSANLKDECLANNCRSSLSSSDDNHAGGSLERDHRSLESQGNDRFNMGDLHKNYSPQKDASTDQCNKVNDVETTSDSRHGENYKNSQEALPKPSNGHVPTGNSIV